MASEWLEWDGLRGIVSREEMEAAKMAGDEAYIKPVHTGQVSGWHVPPTSTCPATAVDSSDGLPNESQSVKLDQNSAGESTDWKEWDDSRWMLGVLT